MSQLSPQTRDTIDSEIQRIVDTQFARAQQLLTEHRTALDTLTTDLLKAETLDGRVVRLALERSPATA
jgi:cell division protease FtsH